MQNFDTIGAVDLGSNSFHMVIARVVDGQVQVIDRLREMVRLAEGLDDEGTLAPAARDRALEALARFGERIRSLPAGAVRVVGTNTLRQSRSPRGFLDAAEAALGHKVEVISGVEEARLIYLGVAHSLGRRDGKRLVMDIGGGSTEFIVGRDFEPLLRESKYMGCVSFSERFFPKGAVDAKGFTRAEIAARKELQNSARKFREAGWDGAIGASGTIKSISDILVGSGIAADGIITLDGLLEIRERVIAAGKLSKLKLAGLNEERVPVFPGGLAILIGAFESLGIEEMIVSDGALREGLLYDLLGRIGDHDVRNETIRQLATKYQVDPDHAAAVERTAIALWGQCAADWKLTNSAHELMLRWASHLHEIGLAIGHSRYHKHGSYIVENADMPGFSRQDQQFLWSLVRSHRRRYKIHRFQSLPRPFHETGPRLAILLRLAVLLNRGRQPEDVPEPAIRIEDQKTIRLTFANSILDASPLTRADLEEEAAYLAAAGFELTFE